MAKYDQGGGCACGLYKECNCQKVEEKLIAISVKEYEDLKADQKFLSALRVAGVDNWDGYSYAFEIMYNNE